ncbi:speckle-type POZ protein B [Trichonephila clavata]|uniref:Speckle-type POZ protein B n=1 Tax=Trichonephila clavata TaxID=2740835 RepID=A0A8X6JC94_TRICU|nr:speckle-type POZ protein B [Trichonephila clavata]
MNVQDADYLSSSEISSVSATVDSEPVDFSIATEVPVETTKFRWILNQFGNLSINTELYSPYIYELGFFSCKLKLVKYENGFGLFHVCCKCQTRPGYMNQTESKPIFAPLRGAKKEILIDEYFPYVVEYQVSVSDKHEREIIKWTTCFANKNDLESFLIGEHRNSSWKTLFRDVLVLRCCMKLTKIPRTEKQCPGIAYSLNMPSWTKLSQDLKSLYQNSIDTDYTLVVESEEIHVNSCILAARSSVFKKMLHHDKDQNVPNVVTITDVPLPAMKRLVEFLYTGAFEDATKGILFEEVYDLYYAADKYEVMDLRKICGTTLMAKASADNVSKILLWADRHNDVGLKSQILNFISLNFETVMDSLVWLSFRKKETELANEALSFCAQKLKAAADK